MTFFSQYVSTTTVGDAVRCGRAQKAAQMAEGMAARAPPARYASASLVGDTGFELDPTLDRLWRPSGL